MTRTLDPSVMFLHCQQCLLELPKDQSPAEYARISVGVTADADLSVWCNRHDMAVTILQNDQVADVLRQVADTPCPACQCEHKPETKH